MFNKSEDSDLKSLVGRSCELLGLPLRLGRTRPLGSIFAETETNLNNTFGYFGRFTWRFLEWVKDDAEAFWKGRRRDSLVGGSRIGKQGNRKKGLDSKLILPPIRATSCIQLDPILGGRGWAYCPNFSSPCCRAKSETSLLCKLQYSEVSSARAYRVKTRRHGPHAKPIRAGLSRCPWVLISFHESLTEAFTECSS